MQYTLMFDLARRSSPCAWVRSKKDAFWGAFLPYARTLFNAGIVIVGAWLEPPDTASTVSIENGRPLVQDGPFAATKEQLGCFFLVIDGPDLEMALTWAARNSAGPGSAVEVCSTLPKME